MALYYVDVDVQGHLMIAPIVSENYVKDIIEAFIILLLLDIMNKVITLFINMTITIMTCSSKTR
jgi:hypothetical protein